MDHRAPAVCGFSFPVLVIGGCQYMQEEAVNKQIVANAMSGELHIYGSSYKPAGEKELIYGNRGKQLC